MRPLIEEPKKLEGILQEIPQGSGVYFLRDQNDEVLYIGKSKKLRNRVRSYFRESASLTSRLSLMIRQVYQIEFMVTDTEAEALALEANFIKKYQPRFNVLLKDDKKYPYLCITWSEKYPRILVTRKRQLKNRQDRYYGPYVDGKALRQTLELIKQIFPLRQRPQPLFKDRPCLNYDLGRCPGVCQDLITPEEYHQIVQKVAMIFQGRSEELIEQLTEQMKEAAKVLNFELAAKIRDQIKSLTVLHSHQKVTDADDTLSRDVLALSIDEQKACIQLFQIRGGNLVGRLGFLAKIPGVLSPSEEAGMVLKRVLEEYYQNVDDVEIPSEILLQYELPELEMISHWLSQKKGKKVTIIVPQRQSKVELILMVERNAHYELTRQKKLQESQHQALEDLADLLDLPELPDRIEGYDISHIQGSDAVGSRVVFIEGIPAPQYYRHYKIKNPEITSGHSDDFASLAEVIERRFTPKSPDQPILDYPDLVMIDGGKGQLSAVVTVLTRLNLLDKLRVISLAKQREEIFLPGESFPLETDPEQPGVQLLRRLRDEAHRFAITFHRQQRTKRMTRSYLDDISGLGTTRKKLLLDHFHSIDYIRIATLEKLQEVSGIGPHLAQQIYDYFHH